MQINRKDIAIFTGLFLFGLLFSIFVFPGDSTGSTGCPEYLSTPKGSYERAQKGWNSDKVKKSHAAIKHVRIQSRCAPTAKGRHTVDQNIELARKQYKKAKKSDELVGLSSSYTAFVYLVEEKTDLSLRVLGAWALAEGGPSDNPLNIGPGYHYGSIEGGAKATVSLLRSGYSGILATAGKSDSTQINAIVASSWCPGCAGYSSLLYGTYSQTSVK